jgi:hypothetical protein
VPFTLVVESDETSLYEEQVRGFGGYGRVLTLDPMYQRSYDACLDLPPGASRGSGPARNFAWDHALSEGHSYYWCLDDNHVALLWIYGRGKFYAGDAGPLRYAEELVRRYKNVAMGGLYYEMFCIVGQCSNIPLVNTRIYSCNLIRTAISQRWRGVYNEDTILSLDLLKAGWNIINSRFGVIDKPGTMRTPGGNTSTIYAEKGAHLRKVQVLVRAHPDVTRVIHRFNRIHHHVDYSQWKNRPCIPFEDAPPMPEIALSVVEGHWSQQAPSQIGEASCHGDTRA